MSVRTVLLLLFSCPRGLLSGSGQEELFLVGVRFCFGIRFRFCFIFVLFLVLIHRCKYFAYPADRYGSGANQSIVHKHALTICGLILSEKSFSLLMNWEFDGSHILDSRY